MLWPTRPPKLGEGEWWNGSARCCALRGGIHGVERLARGHEQAVALGAAEADVAAHLGQPDTADELAIPRAWSAGEMREMGVRGLLALEPLFVCQACGTRPADLRPNFHWKRSR